MKEVTVFIDEKGDMRIKMDNVTKPEALTMLNLAAQAVAKKTVDESRIITPKVENTVKFQ